MTANTSAQDSSTFNAASTTDEVLSGIDLHGKRVLITGGSSGLGLESARALASAGAELILTARDERKYQAASEHIRSQLPQAKLHFCALQLEDLDSCRAAAKALRSHFDSLDFILANAGVMACEQRRTTQGYDWQFGVNHLGHFVFVNHLLPLLKSEDCRVAILSSAGHRAANIRFDDPNFQCGDYDKWVSYGQAKTANALYAVELNRRMPCGTAYAVHPGAIATGLSRHLTRDDMLALGTEMRGVELQLKSIEAGAATQVWALTAATLAGQGGLYLEDCQIAVSSPEGNSGYRPYALDADAAQRLWQLSEQLVGEQFTFVCSNSFLPV